MNRTTGQSDARRSLGAMPTKPSLVIAAIGFHLLLCSISSAADACSGTLDRSARRIPSAMAQAFREIVDRHGLHAYARVLTREGFRLADCITRERSTAPVAGVEVAAGGMRPQLLNLPPPSMG